MTSLEPAALIASNYRRLLWMLGGRLLIAAMLLGAVLYFALDEVSRGVFTATALLFLAAFHLASSVLLAVRLLLARTSLRVPLFAVVIDVVWVTMLVYLTSGAGSVFAALYGLVIVIAAITISAKAGYVTGIISILTYLLVGGGLMLGWIPGPPDQPAAYYSSTPLELTRAMVVYVAGTAGLTVLVSLLAGWLQKTGGELQAAELRAKQLARLNDNIVRSISAGLITTLMDGTIQTINPAGKSILLDSEGTLIGKNLSTIMPEIELEPGPGSTTRAETLGKKADGNVFPVGYSSSILQGVDELNQGILIIFQDLSEVQRLRQRAEHSERLTTLGRIATALAHEIRNPLSSIAGSVQMIRENPVLSNEERKLMNIVSSEVERLDDLVTNMLHVGRTPESHQGNQDLGSIVRTVLDMATADRSHPRDVMVRAEVPPTPVFAHVDSAQITQVLWNLVKNAIAALPIHGGEIVVRAYDDNETANAILEVQDNGFGIAQNVRGKLFDVFSSGRPYGIGIGLALVKQIVDQHQGRIDVKAAEPHGTVFQIWLPKTSTSLRPSLM